MARKKCVKLAWKEEMKDKDERQNIRFAMSEYWESISSLAISGVPVTLKTMEGLRERLAAKYHIPKEFFE